ncbi:MAG: hypothetical protein GQ565_00665 [Candidatus Aegiribacteria sp.]|nr:hypothetical protein [Candidatus Aegiribacteria sp.]
MYWIWATEAQNETQARVHGRPAVVERLGLAFDRGLVLTQSIPEIKIKVSAEDHGTLTDSLIALGTTGLVFNGRVRKLLLQNGVDNIDYFPATVILESSGQFIADYMIANIVGRISCVSPESELQLDDNGAIEFIDRLVLDVGKPQGILMFRLAEYLQIVVVHDRVKKAAEAAQITGVNFYRPEDYTL